MGGSPWRVGLAWITVLAAASVPIGVALPGTWAVDPLVSWPVLWLLFCAVTVLLSWLWFWTPAGAVFVAYLVIRTGWDGWPVRGTVCLLLVLAMVLAYLGAASIRPDAEPWLVVALLIGVGINAGLGALNLFGIYPALEVRPDVWRWPHGRMGNPNHWGLLMAVGLPAVWWVVRGVRWRWIGLVAWVGFLALSHSVMAVMAGVGVLAVLAIRQWGRRGAVVFAAGVLVGLLGIGLMKPTWTGGRWAVWQVGVQTALIRPWLGHGLGTWQSWALWPSGPIMAGAVTRWGLTFPAQGPFALAWTEAHNEAVQVWFELGAVGVDLLGWLMASVGRQAWRVFRAPPGLGWVWALMVLVGLVSLWGTIPFRLPAIALPLVLAMARLRVRSGVLT